MLQQKNLSQVKYTTVQVEDGKDDNNKPAVKNSQLDRESSGWMMIILLGSLYIFIDVWKQVANYGMRYYNNGSYPLPQSQLVAITELFKFLVFFTLLIYQGGYSTIQISYWYAIPSLTYALNNNIYLYALNFVSPPVWAILIQLRLAATAFVYRVVFKRTVTYLQYVALFILMTTIACTQLAGTEVHHPKISLESGENNTKDTVDSVYHSILPAVLLAVIGSITSTIGCVTMEYLFKNENRSFTEMQTQLYGFSTAGALLIYGIQLMFSTQSVNFCSPQLGWHCSLSLLLILIISSILLNCIGGVTVAGIVKCLDNIVKLYTQALANMGTSIACALFFPQSFSLNPLFITFILVVFVTIYLYEKKTLEFSEIVEMFNCKRDQSKLSWIAKAIMLKGSLVVLLYFGSKSVLSGS